MIETWRGNANAWECDELGHLNMRFYVAKAHQARAAFAKELGLVHLFKSGAGSALRPKEHHIIYLAEARPGAGLIIHTGMIDLGEKDIQLLHIIRHTDGRIAATVLEKLSHVATRTNKTFPWPRRVRNSAPEYACDIPNEARARGIDLSEKPEKPHASKLDGLGMQCIGRGVFQPEELDSLHYVRSHDIMGRVSDSVIHFTHAWPDVEQAGVDRDGVLLEARLRLYKRPRAGDAYMIYSGLTGYSGKVRSFTHWILDPVSGRAWGCMQAVAGLMDMKTRKLVAPDRAAIEVIQDKIVSL